MSGLEIQIKDLNLVLSGNEILENINLTVKAGEVHCLVGPNGGGKRKSVDLKGTITILK